MVKVKRRQFILTVMHCNCYLANWLVLILPPLERRVPRNRISVNVINSILSSRVMYTERSRQEGKKDFFQVM